MNVPPLSFATKEEADLAAFLRMVCEVNNVPVEARRELVTLFLSAKRSLIEHGRRGGC